jgi:flagellin
MQTQINGLNQGVSNSNDGVSMVQTASSGLSSLTSSLQRIRSLATQATNGSMTDTDRAALQQEVSQQVSEINRIASQTTYNGMNVLNGSLGTVSFQVGANVGQTISLNLSQNMSAAAVGSGVPQAGNTLGSFTNLSLDSAGSYVSSGAAITSVNVISDGSGGFTLTDQNNQAISYSAVSGAFSGAGLSSDASGNAVVTSGSAASFGSSFASDLNTAMSSASTDSYSSAAETAIGSTITGLNTVSTVASIDISSQSGASMAMESIDNALNTLNNLQATLGAAQNRFTAIGTTQQAQSTDLSTAQSSIQDADFAQETANLSKAQVLQQAGISVLAQANSQPQQILKLLQ